MNVKDKIKSIKLFYEFNSPFLTNKEMNFIIGIKNFKRKKYVEYLKNLKKDVDKI